MNDFHVPDDSAREVTTRARLYPMKIGEAIVYVQQTGPEPEVEENEFYPVSAPDPEEAFQHASAAIKECVQVVGERIKQLAADAKPDEISVEFSLGFEAKGKAWFIPILVQAEATGKTAVAVKAVWKLGPAEGTA